MLLIITKTLLKIFKFMFVRNKAAEKLKNAPWFGASFLIHFFKKTPSCLKCGHAVRTLTNLMRLQNHHTRLQNHHMRLQNRHLRLQKCHMQERKIPKVAQKVTKVPHLGDKNANTYSSPSTSPSLPLSLSISLSLSLSLSISLSLYLSISIYTTNSQQCIIHIVLTVYS